MEKINNIDTIQEVQKALGYVPTKIPKLDTRKVILTRDVTEDFHRTITKIGVIDENVTRNGVAIFTTSANKDTYVVSIGLQNMSDVTADNENILISATLASGKTQNILSMRKISLTTFSQSVRQDFPIPLKLARNSAVSFTNVFTVGASVTTGYIYYFEV